MKKFVSMAMVAAMTVSMVPATAFAAGEVSAKAKIVDALEITKDEAKANPTIAQNYTNPETGVQVWKDKVPELKLTITDVDYRNTDAETSEKEVTLTLDNAEFLSMDDYTDLVNMEAVYGEITDVTATLEDADEITFVFTGEFMEDDVITFDLESVLDKTGTGNKATVSVSGDLVEVDDLTYVSILGQDITATTKKVAVVAEEEVTTLEKDLKIKAAVGEFAENQVIELRLSNGFEFTNKTISSDSDAYTFQGRDENYIELVVEAATDEIVINADDIEIEAVDAKSGAVATMTVKATGAFKATTKVEVMKVVDYTVMMSVDEDEDVPVIYSGVDVSNYGITDDSDHISLEVTIEESFPGAWSMRKGFNLELPEGVYVTDVEVNEAKNFMTGTGDETTGADEDDWEAAFWDAYQETDHKGFEFEKRVFNDVDTELADDPAEVSFELTLVADPGFVGDVNLKLTGDLVDEQEVTIAKFVTPYYVTAEQNDLKIDYRYTEVPSTVVIKEAEAGLWDKDEAEFTLYMDKWDSNFLEFEDADVVVDAESGMEIDEKVDGGIIKVVLEEESDEVPATITVENMEMFMSRSIPAGPYDLKAVTSFAVGDYSGDNGYLYEDLFAADTEGKHHSDPHDCDECKEETYVGCVADFESTVKEGFINVVTAGREQDDASFTTKVVVPVGESYIVAGENQVTLDVPAYVSAAGYTMLPVRAVATALGINNNNVIWNGESKTVTILYGQRIITMVAGQKTVNVNGSVIPASAAVEITDGRTFLPMRDLATALGVTDITWDAATKTATLNGGVQ